MSENSASPAEIKKKVREFVLTKLNSDLIDLDRQEKFNYEGWRECGEFGFQGLLIPKAYGGLGTDTISAVATMEALGYHCQDNGLIFSIGAHLWACVLPIYIFGTEAQRQKYLPKLCKGEWIGGHAVSEPEAGSDVYSLQTIARKEGNNYYISGRKIFVTNGPVADVHIVFATLDPSKGKKGITGFIVEKDRSGFIVERQVSKMGVRTAMMGELNLDNCRVPAENLLGGEGSGVPIFTHSMEWERGFILAGAVGTMERLLERCIRYARQRHQFEQSIGKFQMIASKIAEMKLRLETSRALLYKVAALKQSGKSALPEAAMAKLHISESWVQSCMDAIQIHGGRGYLTETELERELRDAIGSQIYSGTSEIQRLIISQFLGL